MGGVTISPSVTQLPEALRPGRRLQVGVVADQRGTTFRMHVSADLCAPIEFHLETVDWAAMKTINDKPFLARQ